MLFKFFFFFTSAVVTLNKSPVFPLVPWVLLSSFSIYIAVVVEALCNSTDHPGAQAIRRMGSRVLPLDKEAWFCLALHEGTSHHPGGCCGHGLILYNFPHLGLIHFIWVLD